MKYSELFTLLAIVIVGGVAYKFYAEFIRKAPADAAANTQQAQPKPAPAGPAAIKPVGAKAPPPSARPRQLSAERRPAAGQPDRPASAKSPGRRPADDKKFRVALPSGAAMDHTMMNVPANWQASNLPRSAQVYILPYPSGATHGIFALKDGRCHGASASLHPGGALCTLAYYNKGQLSGPLRLWAADRVRLLYAEYANGQRHGLLCFFTDDAPCLLQQWKYGKLAEEYFVRPAGLESTAVPKSEISANSDDGRRLEAGQQRLDDLLAEIETNERNLKQYVAGWYRKESERIKRERAASQTAAKRDAILSRTEARNASKASAWEAQLQHALRTWP